MGPIPGSRCVKQTAPSGQGLPLVRPSRVSAFRARGHSEQGSGGLADQPTLFLTPSSALPTLKRLLLRHLGSGRLSQFRMAKRDCTARRLPVCLYTKAALVRRNLDFGCLWEWVILRHTSYHPFVPPGGEGSVDLPAFPCLLEERGKMVTPTETEVST